MNQQMSRYLIVLEVLANRVMDEFHAKGEEFTIKDYAQAVKQTAHEELGVTLERELLKRLVRKIDLERSIKRQEEQIEMLRPYWRDDMTMQEAVLAYYKANNMTEQAQLLEADIERLKQERENANEDADEE
jgi:hypothetical protein